MYPSIVINNNISFDTLNCICCKYDPQAEISQATIDVINQHLQENQIDRRVSKYWICRKRKGAFPIILEQVLSDRDNYLKLLEQEKLKHEPDDFLLLEYGTHQIGAKLFANAGFGLFANEYFRFKNYKVAECITGEGRRIHQQMELLATQNGFDIVFGFTDSTFITINESAVEGRQPHK
jgi:DNA polymerase elongation subunit (family B)